MEKKEDNRAMSVNSKIYIAVAVFGLMAIGYYGYGIGARVGDEKADRELTERSCMLYENYQTAYKFMDTWCETTPECKGSQRQKDSQADHATWEQFNRDYCR